MGKSLIIVIAVALLTALPALGGPLAMNQVSAAANWVVHADCEQFNKSRLGQLVRAELANLGIEEQLKNFATVFSFHPLDDVRDVTIYGQGQDRDKAIVLIEGRFDKEKLLALVRMNPKHEQTQYGSIVIHGWQHEEKIPGHDVKEQMMYGCFYRDDLIVMSAGLSVVKHAVDVVNGSAATAVGGAFDAIIMQSKGIFFQVAANNLAQTVGDQQKAAVLKQAHQLALAVGQDEKNVYINANLKADSQEAAGYIKKILDGIVAYLALAGKEQPKLAALVERVNVSCVQDTVQIHFRSQPEPVLQFLKEQSKRQQKDETKS